ncbi:glycosyltransferase family 2 protein [Corynebacterium lowii]|uniref:N-acetylglucosaminyl-diphospho-decaprenol L-rhamnosyltransferase n=1 Tax=Corynebacterium lowii TaxID=1544413 RepID=A0A0Q0UGK9_9CORY|nr:glycosyltransferase family 2 protein [Corynebacterium lowii]KQB87534.1 N-acetylglucosaminyl-diphospho-decaprenol L-rhamnosyltransferase [Corynebacterium lowii]MDP9851871.1 N-acetylglucosaminyl-diphospho-decaprenol L-rhamnosyltransferase [Corynebacterium lowii]
MSPAPLAVITVTFSPGRHLPALLDSLGAATTLPTHVLLADNGSTDGSPQAAVGPGVELLNTGGNLGYGRAINAAARHLAPRRERGEINGEFFLVVNPDVEFTPGSIDELLACARRRDNAAAVGPLIRQNDGSAYPSARALPSLRTGIGHALLGNIWPNNPWTRAYKAGEDMSEERRAGWLSGSCLLLRWADFEAIGGFDERYFMYMEDVDLGDRLGRAGKDNVLCPTAVIEHDQGHVARRYSGVTVPAHHASAYRFLADRLPGWWRAPLRGALWVGLRARAAVLRLRG